MSIMNGSIPDQAEQVEELAKNKSIHKQFMVKDYDILNDFSMKNVIQICLEKKQNTTARMLITFLLEQKRTMVIYNLMVGLLPIILEPENDLMMPFAKFLVDA